MIGFVLRLIGSLLMGVIMRLVILVTIVGIALWWLSNHVL